MLTRETMAQRILVRAVESTLILALLCAMFLAPTTMAASAQKPLEWIKPGLHVSYYAISSSLTISPWSAWQANDKNTVSVGVPGAQGWTEKIKILEPGKISAVNIFEHFVVENVDKDGVHMYYAGWSIKKELGVIENEILTPIRKNKPFNGPFWVDPKLLAKAREGGSIVIPQEGEKVVYQVVFIGQYDISPFTKKKNMALDIMIPLPKGSVREVIGLRAIRSIHVEKGGIVVGASMVHEMVVDKATGLILMEAVMTGREVHGALPQLSNVKRSMYARYLAGINMDLESVLPSYNARDYDYGTLINTGYIVSAEGMLSPGGTPSLEGIIVSYSLGIVGVYKNKATFLLSLFIGVQPPVTKTYLGVVDLETGETRIEFSADILTGEIQEVGKTFPVGLLFIPKDMLGRENLEILGTPYTLMGVQEASIEGIGNTRLYVYKAESDEAVISLVAYAETKKGGLIVALQPGGIPGYAFAPVQGQGEPPNTPQYLTVIDEKTTKSTSVGTSSQAESSSTVQQGINASIIEQILGNNTTNNNQKPAMDTANTSREQEAKPTNQSTDYWHTTFPAYAETLTTPQKPSKPETAQKQIQTLQTKNSEESNEGEILKIASINAIAAVVTLTLVYSWKVRRSRHTM